MHSDYKPLENLEIKTKHDEELRELMLQLSQFDFTFEYVPGDKNAEADCLSSNPVFKIDEPSNNLKIVNFIEMSDILKDQRQNMQNWSSKLNTIIKNNVIFKKYKNTEKLIVSDTLAKDLIKMVHTKMGHIGPKQMELTIFPHFYNTNFMKLIRQYTQNCSICIKNKSRVLFKFGLLSHLGPAIHPFHYMSLDTIGGLAGNNSPKKYFHLLVDHVTRFAYCSSSSTQKASDFIKLINSVLKNGNKIENLLADQYTGINSADFKNFLNSQNINLILTSVDCPSSNGLNERLNQTLVNRLRCKINESEQNKRRPWSVLMDNCIREYNDTVHTVTKFTPNYLMNNVKYSLFPNLAMKAETNLEEDRRKALFNSEASHRANKKILDKRKKPGDFQVGDLVYVHHGNSLNRNKLDELRLGPFPIRRVISPSIYEVGSGFQKRESNIYHISKLYPYLQPE